MKVLGMFFSKGISLQNWVDLGLYDREVLIYNHHIASGFFTKIFWFTYGINDKEIEDFLKKNGKLNHSIEIVPCPKWISFDNKICSSLYSLLLPFVHYRKLVKCDVYKTNQMSGSISAIISSIIYRHPLYLRTGYTLTRVLRKIVSRYHYRYIFALIIEFIAYRYASVSSVTSLFDKNYIFKKYNLKKSNFFVIGNYVDVNKFHSKPLSNVDNNKVLFVGRLSIEKNIDNLIKACSILAMQLDIIGQGDQLDNLKQVAKLSNVNVNFLGIFPNSDLPNILNNYKYFILPSFWEGLPKSLLEAMSCGLICIGNNTTGINEIISHGVNGFLSPKPDHNSLAMTLNLAINSDHKKISTAAINFIKDNYSLESIAGKERLIFTSLFKY
jgi:glycosyltransferase involved in cell wall biosynthesis